MGHSDENIPITTLWTGKLSLETKLVSGIPIGNGSGTLSVYSALVLGLVPRYTQSSEAVGTDSIFHLLPVSLSSTEYVAPSA